MERNSIDLAQIRRNLELSQAQLGDILGVNQSTISRFENGTLPIDKRTRMAIESLCANRTGIAA